MKGITKRPILKEIKTSGLSTKENYGNHIEMKPSRPITPHERSQRFHYVTGGPVSFVHPDDLMGHVYITVGNRAIYWTGKQDDPKAQDARYLDASPQKLLTKKQNGYILQSELGPIGSIVDETDRSQLLCDYYGDKKGLLILAQTIG